jgi:tetratricopeptide (TPR) repeat protein
MRPSIWISAVLALGVLAGIDVVAQPAAQADYRALVDAYRSGQSAALDRIATAAEADVHAWIEGARSDRSGTWNVEALRAAAIAHTEVWVRAIHDRRPESAVVHLRAATRLFERVRDDGPGQDEYIDRWRTVVLGLLARLVNQGQAEEFAARASALFPTNPQRERAIPGFNAGLAAERQGSEYGVRARSIMAFRDDSLQRWWAHAAASYVMALKRDPSHEMAALHLGRTRMLQGERAEAARHFTSVVDAGDPRVRYLALLFLGSLAEREGRDADAERAYVDALRAYPLGQAGLLALCQLFSRTGQETKARQIIAVLAARKGNVEPLWTYLPPPRLDLVDYQMFLNELRAEVSK